MTCCCSYLYVQHDVLLQLFVCAAAHSTSYEQGTNEQIFCRVLSCLASYRSLRLYDEGLMTCIAHQMLFGWSNPEEWVGAACSKYKSREGNIELGGETWGNEPLGSFRPRWKDNIKMFFKEWDGEAWTGLFCLRIGTGGGRLWMRKWTFEFNSMWDFFLPSWRPDSFSKRTQLLGPS